MKTKSILLFVAISLLAPAALLAQTTFGLRTGVAATTLSAKGDLYNDNNVTFSYTAGAFSTIQLNKSLAIQPELNYVRKGRSNETTELNTSTETNFLIDYLQVPVLFQYRNDELLNKSGSVFYIHAGPYAAFVLDTKTKVSDDSENASAVDTDDSKNTDWGATMGIGFQTPIFKQDICFDLRYDMGLSEIAQQPTDYRTKALSLTVGIKF